MFRKVSILLLSFVTTLLLVSNLPVAAKQPTLPDHEKLLDLAQEQGATGEKLEFTIITDQEQIRKELESIGVDYDKAIDELAEGTTEGVGGHAGVMLCTGPDKANDLFLVAPGGFGTAFFGGSLSDPIEIGGCIGGGVCGAFPACLVNAVCPLPTGITAIAYAVTGVYTTDLGWGCGP